MTTEQPTSAAAVARLFSEKQTGGSYELHSDGKTTVNTETTKDKTAPAYSQTWVIAQDADGPLKIVSLDPAERVTIAVMHEQRDARLTKANARMSAAAPELLAACIDLLALAARQYTAHPAMTDARAAIAKAKGSAL